MPNPKNSKGGRKNKRANSSGDEQENGAGALAVAGAGPGAANAAAAAGAAAAGDAKNGKSGPVGRAPTSSPTGTARRRRGPGWRGRCVDNARVRKCSPRPSAPPRLPLPGPHARWRRSISGPGSVSARLSGHAPRAACAPNSEGLSGPRSGRRCPWALPVVPALAKPSVCPRPGGRKEGRKERAAQVEKNGPIENLEAPCATPLICSFGRPVDLEKDDYQKVVCNNEHCPHSTWMHLQCFYEWESSILVQFNCIGRARSWNEKQCRQNMWTKKGYDLAFRFCSCRCGQGHLKKDTDWYQVKRMQDEKKKKSGSEKNTGRPPGEAVEEAKKCRPPSKPQKGLSHDLPRRHSMDRQNSQEKGGAGAGAAVYGARSPCGSPGQSPPTGYSILSPAHFSGPRSSRYLGEFLKNAIHLEPHKKALAGGHVFRNAHFDYSPAGLSVHRGGHFDAPVQFLRRLDLSELLTHIPRHKLNTFHVRMEDDAQMGQGEDLRKFILAALSASHRNVVNCALCHRVLPVFEQFPLVDGTLFLSPSRHDEIEYDVPCHLQGRLMHLYAVCVDCLEGVHKIICIKCKSRWDGSWHQLGTMYTYDILAASPCCQARLNCKHCGKPVIDVRIGMQYFSEYSNVQQCPHCGNLDYHFVKPFSSFKVLEAY
uniref:Hdc homolog, cell cycle regulator n=2 Tax=Bos TaxID=9903 RepID=F1ML56_BOVIN